MTIQILDIVVYSHDGRRRELPLNPGKVNIVTGSSKSGKSALIEIVNYCFGSGKCAVPVGPIRYSVSWFGLRLQLSDGQAMIARRCPSPSAHSSEDCFVSIASDITLPDHKDLKQTTNTKGLISLLTQWCGIKENLHLPLPGHTRLSLAANVRHALLLCFQPQDEIIRRQNLFHRSDDRDIALAIQDTLPYFLGAVDDDYVMKRIELRRLKDELRLIERQISEINNIRGDGTSKAAGLLAQARETGLTDALVNSWEAAVNVLKLIANTPLSSIDTSKTDSKISSEFNRLSIERQKLLDNQHQLQDEIAAVKAIEVDGRGYTVEVEEQRARLVSIGIFEGMNVEQHSCPLCTQPIPSEALPPYIDQIKDELSEISNQLDAVSNVGPQIVKAVAELEGRLHAIHDQLHKNRSELEAVRAASDTLTLASDVATRQAHILGRITLFVESMPELADTRNLETRAAELRNKCQQIEEALSDELIQERLTSISILLGKEMTEWSKNLLLEHSDAPIRLDLKKLTVIADTADGPIPMTEMGSGENWVSYHLISHLVLHKWFVLKERPLPRFLFLDQPSQVYFPPERDIEGALNSGKEEDRLAVIRMFKLIINVVEALNPGLQVILTEHADIAEDWFQSAIAQRWRNGIKLIPEDWPRA